ncbi:MAG: ABC transporter ATP-binding protein [Rhodospirillales bacterium]|nr:ABC transporter ATP-binding protein [Rhodospirillales bacterium]MDE2574982.1 ABC transporter ATP-binding protein [Rhodospirillales bacterium]
MFAFFESLLRPTEVSPEPSPPALDERRGLLRFYWHFARQVRGKIAILFAAGLVVAMLDAAIPVFIGRVVTLVSTHAPATLLAQSWPALLGMAAVLVLARPLALFGQNLITNQVIAAGLTNLIRWQSHWHVVRQSWSFFQNDFAGRIANRVMQTGPALRESIVSSVNAVWYIIVYGSSAAILLGRVDVRLAAPMLCWFVAYVLMLRYFVPRMRDRSRAVSYVRSGLTGRIVDSYSNILTVKLFARARDEDSFVREALDEHTDTFRRQLRLTTGFVLTLALMNAGLVVGTGAAAILLWTQGRIAVGSVAMALPLAWQIANIAGWVAQNVTAIFENVGIVQEGMRSIAVTRQMPDAPGATELAVTQGGIRFEGVRFGYGTERGVLHDLSLAIAPGERVGLVGHSGAGKSTLVNLLLHFHAPEAGRILIDGQDIAGVTQESLRGQIAMVTQDTALLHRSIRDNIRYGRPWADEADIVAAARQAEALDFIETLEDWDGRRGFDAHVGERGVKLSGGQRQRIAIARVILKDAPILVLDEATSALDSEVEAAIQSQLETLMRGRTVIAIAHRLSTIARMDRLIVLDHGRIAEQGSHAALLAAGGPYARMWRRQSGGFARAAE